jgi:hypothetical protein
MRFLVLDLGFLSSNVSLCFLVSGKMFSTSSSNFRGLNHGEGGNQGDDGGGCGSHREVGLDQSRSYGDVGSGHSESVDVVSSVVDSLHHIVGINILVAASGHTESVFWFRSGRVDVLVAKAELTQLVLGVELAGWSYGSDGGDGKRLGQGDRGGSKERLLDRDRLGERLGGERKRGRNWSRKDEGLVSQSYWSRNHWRLDQDWRHSEHWSSGNSIAGLNRLGLAPSSLRNGSNLRLGGLVSGKMFSPGSGHFRCLQDGDGGNQGGDSGNFGSHGQTNSSSCRSHGHVGSGHSESVDVVSSVVDSLDHIVGINVLVAASGHTESVLWFRSGRVDVLVAKAELTQLVLGVELAGRRLNNRSYWGDGGNGERLGKGDRGGGQERLRREGERNRLSG